MMQQLVNDLYVVLITLIDHIKIVIVSFQSLALGPLTSQLKLSNHLGVILHRAPYHSASLCIPTFCTFLLQRS